MQTFAIFGLVASLASTALAQGGASPVSGGPPAGCSKDYSGQFEITTVLPSGTGKRDFLKRQSSSCGQTGILTIGLAGGKLTDNLGRTGYIASNNSQFQFDAPPQAGAIDIMDFSICGNGSLAVGPSTVFYQCNSGSFSNLYTVSQGPQCQLINIDVISCSGSGTGAPVSQTSDAQPQGTASASKAPVSQLSDAQPQGTASPSKVPVSQTSDAQPQVTASPTKAPVSVFTDGQPQATANATVKAAPTIATAGGAVFTAPAVMVVAGALAAAFL